MKKCPKCKIQKENTEFYKNKKRKDGLRSYCKLCEKKANNERESNYKKTRKIYQQSKTYKSIKHKYYLENKERILSENAKWRQTLKGRLGSYKKAARDRNISWNITDKEFASFWQKDCYYCGDSIETIGIDRVDSKQSYEMSNLVPCCSQCNKIKMDLTLTEFLTKINKIYELQRNRG